MCGTNSDKCNYNSLQTAKKKRAAYTVIANVLKEVTSRLKPFAPLTGDSPQPRITVATSARLLIELTLLVTVTAEAIHNHPKRLEFLSFIGIPEKLSAQDRPILDVLFSISTLVGDWVKHTSNIG